MTTDPVAAFLTHKTTDAERAAAARTDQARRAQDANDYARWGRTRGDAEAERAEVRAENRRTDR